MKKAVVISIAIVVAAVLLIAPLFATPTVKAARTKGPRSDYADIYFYGSEDAAYAALKAGEVDFIQWWLTYDQLRDAESDPNLCVASYFENGMFEIDIHNNYTIAAYPGIRSPTNDVNFRRAIACAIDKQFIINTIYSGFGVQIDVPICAPQEDPWWNPAVTGANYPYKFNMTKAREYLQAAGFVDSDGDGVVEFPADWPGLEGKSVDERELSNYPLIFYVRTEDLRLEVGRYVYNQLITLLGPGTVNKKEVTRAVTSTEVMRKKNYHLYTGGWSFGRFPTYFYFIMSGDWYFPPPYAGYNYVTGWDANGEPNYPELDYWLRKIWYAANVDDAIYACKKAQEIYMDVIPNIPLLSSKSYVAWRTTVAGVVNMKGYGFENGYTFLNAYRIDNPGQPIRMGTISNPDQLNLLFSQWYFDYAVLDRLSDGLIGVNPYDLNIDQPAMAKDWEVSTWVDPTDGLTKTKVRYWLRSDIGITEPGTGRLVRYLNASDYEWYVWFNFAFQESWRYGDVMDVKFIRIVDPYTVDVYFNDLSMWFVYSPTAYILNRYELEPLLCEETTLTFAIEETSKDETLVIPGIEDLDFPTVVRVVSATFTPSGGSPTTIKEHVDFEIVSEYETGYRDMIWFLKDFPAGTISLTIKVAKDASGFFLGGYDWTEVMYSIGPYYMKDFTAGVGGHAILNANPYYYLETPPLGEIDWRYFWNAPNTHTTAESHPIGGYYQINILDVSRAAASYGFKGTGPFDPNFFPGADIDAYLPGQVGITDITTITGKYGQKWGIYA